MSLIERIEFFDAELLRAFMLDLIIFFDCVYVRRWNWWLFVVVHRRWIRRIVVELKINEIQFLMLCLKWIWMLSLWFVSFAFVCLLKIWLSFFFFAWNHVFLWKRIISMRNKWIEKERWLNMFFWNLLFLCLRWILRK